MGNPFEELSAQNQMILDRLDRMEKRNLNEHYLDKDEFMRLEPAADYLGIKVSTLRSYINKRVIPYHKRSTMIYLKKSDLNEYIEQGRVEKKPRFLRSA
ncbi:helix-turn-helix domain-containing protein [Dyadobacter diqingensis]|uniref:helix-turn-helix domain-containing protein n=1 Tax=Dyadobacter diqingensis TaxID=2938121 RepID=UPI0020C51DFA|nr:helix-turn-helix domain-containing protein [Dyadobacter diqingensis]